MIEPLSKHRIFLVSLLLALTTLVVFWQLGNFDFVNYDDDNYVTENPNVNSGLTLKSVLWSFTTLHGETSYWHPLTWLSHMLDCELFGLNPRWHHLTNLLLHIANTLLLFLVLKNMTGAVWQSGFVAALFALHPLHVESVAWVAERKDILSSFFWILTMIGYLWYIKHGGIGWYLLMIFVFGLGLMTKPMLVTLPFVLMLMDYWPLERFGKVKISRLIIEKIPLFSLSVILSIVTFVAQRSLGAVAEIESISFRVRLANAVVSYIKYILKMVWPGDLAVLYPHPGGRLPMWQPVVSVVLLVGITAAVLYFGRRKRYLIFGWLWYLGTLVPVIGMVQVGAQAMADRYSYITLTGLFVIIAWAVPEFLAKLPHRRIVLAVGGGVVVLVLSICSSRQLKIWQNSFTLFDHTLKVTENNYIMHNSLANVLASQGSYNEAIGHYHRAIRIKPDYTEAHYNLGRAFQSQGLLDEAMSSYRWALSIRFDYANAHNNLGNVLKSKGKFNEAVIHFQQAIQFEPGFAEAHYNLANVFKSEGRLDKAIVHYQRAIEFQLADSDVYNNLANVFHLKGQFDAAIDSYRKSLQIDPDYLPARNNLGIVLLETGQLDEAFEHFRQVVRQRPDWPSASNGLAHILATHPNPNVRNVSSAIEFAEHAAKLTDYQQPVILNTLAEAYAAAGQFDRAISTAQKAFALAEADRNQSLTDQIQKQIQLYKQKSTSHR